MAKISAMKQAVQAGRTQGRTTTKEKVRRKRGVGITQERRGKHLKRAKEARRVRKNEAEQMPTETPILLRSEEQSGGKPRRQSAFTDRMAVDDFLEHGFLETMGENGTDDEEDNAERKPHSSHKDEQGGAGAARKRGKLDVASSVTKPGRGRQHKDDLQALARSDPEFFEYMKKTDPALLSFTPDDDEGDDDDDAGAEEEEEEEDDDDEADDDEEDEDEEDEDGGDDESSDEDAEEDEVPSVGTKVSKTGKAAPTLVEVTPKMVRDWQTQLKAREHTASLKEAVTAFKAAVRFGDSDSAEDDVFTFASGHVFNLVMQFCLQDMDDILRRHVAGGVAALASMRKTKAGVERPDQWTHWRRHQPIVKSYLTHLMQFLGQLTEASMVAVTLQQVHRLLPFFCALPKLAPKLLKALLKVWSADDSSGGSQQITLLAFAAVRQLGVTMPYPFIEHCFKGLYLAYAQACRATTRQALSRIVLMSSCYVDLCAVDAHAAYRHAFVYIRQLAIHLRNAILKASPEASRQVYNWQFVNCLRVWAQVLCAHARSSTAPLRQLVYPLVQVCLGTARLLPSIRYASLRLHCARILNQIGLELAIYVPVAPLLLEALQFSELSKTPKAGAPEKPLDWATMVKASAAECTQRRYQEGLVQEVLYLLAEHMNSICCSIAFPEIVAPTVLALRSAAKQTRIVALQKRCKRLLVQLEAQAKYVAQQRDRVDFAPADATAATIFLKDSREAEDTPFARWFTGERADALKAEQQLAAQAAAQSEGVKVDNDDAAEADARSTKQTHKMTKKGTQRPDGVANEGSHPVKTGAVKQSKKGKRGRGDGSDVADEVAELRSGDLDVW